MKYSFILILFAAFTVNSCTGQTIDNKQTSISKIEKWIADIEYFEKEFLKKSNSYPQDSIMACKQALYFLKKNAANLTNNQIILELSRCVAMANNGHTTINCGWMKKVPVRFYWFSDGLYIIKTSPTLSKYLGAKVLMINSLETTAVFNQLKPYLSGIESWKKYTSTNYLCSPQLLSGIGISEPDSLELTILKGIDTLTVKLATSGLKDKYEYNAWTNLYPQNLPENTWEHALSKNEKLPLYLKNIASGVFYTFLHAEKIAYFNINELWYNCHDFKGVVNEFLDSLKQNTDYNIVIDLRYFAGGNYLLTLDLASEPPQIIDPDKKIYLITSNTTFSAGLITASRIKYFAKDKAIIVGEHVGDSLKFRAEGIYYKLPHSGISIQDSKYEHDWVDNKFKPFKTYWFNLFVGVPAENLKVDKEIKLSFEDYVNRKDPVLEWVIDDIEK